MFCIHQFAGLAMNLLKNERVGNLPNFRHIKGTQFRVSIESKITLSFIFNDLCDGLHSM